MNSSVKNEVTIFENSDLGKVRIVQKGNELWFVVVGQFEFNFF